MLVRSDPATSRSAVRHPTVIKNELPHSSQDKKFIIYKRGLIISTSHYCSEKIPSVAYPGCQRFVLRGFQSRISAGLRPASHEAGREKPLATRVSVAKIVCKHSLGLSRDLFRDCVTGPMRHPVSLCSRR